MASNPPVGRVLLAHPSADVYGSDRQLVESIRGLRDAGWHVELHLRSDGPLRDLVPDLEPVVAPFPVLQKALLRPRGLLTLAFTTPRDLLRLVRRIRRARPDVVYVNTVTIPLWVVAARLLRVPVVVHVHEAEPDLPRPVAWGLYAPLLGARFVVANSGSAADVLAAAVPALARRTRVVHNGVPDPGAATDAVALPGRVALVGRLSPRKGIDVALEAVAMLRAEGRDVTLDVCGSVYPGYEWYEAQVRARAAAPDLAGAVRFLGYVNPTAPVLADASVVVVPSRVEPFGNTAVEALLVGRPLVASRVQGLAEIVEDRQTGLLVEPGDAASLARGIAACLDDPDAAAARAGRGREDAVRRFDPAAYQARIVAVVSGAVTAGPPPAVAEPGHSVTAGSCA